jgi:hypothetical protein
MYLIIRQFQRTQFGRHSERLDPDQLQLKLKEREIASAHERAAAEKRMTHPRAEPGVRKSLPAHLPHDFGRRVMRMQCWAGMTSSRSDFSSPITSIRLPRVRRGCVFRGKPATDSGMKSATDSDLIAANPI